MVQRLVVRLRYAQSSMRCHNPTHLSQIDITNFIWMHILFAQGIAQRQTNGHMAMLKAECDYVIMSDCEYYENVAV